MQQPSSQHEPAANPEHRSYGPSALVGRLGFMAAAEYLDDLRLFFLIGICYHEGAQSLRGIAKIFRMAPVKHTAGDAPAGIRKGLATSLRAIHSCIAALEELLGVQLVRRTGEGLGFNGLTEAGERFWAQTAAFLREFWA